jgi:hypothetical protein
MTRHLGWLGWLLVLALTGACEDDDPSTTCLQDTDCKKVDDCCEGCLAVSITEVVPACAADCIQSACMSTNQEDHVAACKRDTCTLVAPSN